MARILTTGFETGDITEAGTTVIGSNNSLAVVSATPTPRFGGAYCLKAASTSSITITSYKSFALPAALSEVWVRFGLFVHSAGSTNEQVVLGFQDSAGGNQACVTFSHTDLQFRARLSVSNGGTLLAASGTTGGYAIDTWHLVEVRWQASSTTVGVMEVWIDGVRVINFSGDTTFTANVNVLNVLLGGVVGTTAVSGTYVAIDDIAINDTTGTVNNGRPGDGRVVYLAPNGAGSSTVLVRGGVDTGANWSQASEVPPSMAQYVQSSTVGDRDLYALGDLPPLTTSVSVVEVVALAQNSDAGAGSLGLTIKSGATVSEAAAQALSSGPAYVRARYETDPATSAAWTAAAVNALEVGVTVR